MSEAAETGKKRRISSPEELHDYMHVTGPGLWTLLAVIIALLVGMLILASGYKLENTLEVQAETYSGRVMENGSTPLHCTLTDERRSLVKSGMKVRVAGEEGHVSTMLEEDGYTILAVELDRENVKLKDGTYDAEIILESVSPISFLLQK